jgi:hyperosmotically inducible periplasmic protein
MIRVLGVLGIGALCMYFRDPVSGRRRRALLREQLVHAKHEIDDYAEGKSKDLRNRAEGVIADTRNMMEQRP